MGDKENTIDYTPDELEEIKRIVGVVEEHTAAMPVAQPYQPSKNTAVAEAGDEPDGSADFSSAGLEEAEPSAAEGPVMDELVDEIGDIDIDAPDLSSVRKEGPEEISEIEDITDMVQEVDEAPGDITDEIREIEEPVPARARKKPALPEDTAGQLDALTSDEPDTLDVSDLAPAGEFVDREEAPARRPREVEELGDIDLGDIGATPSAVEPEQVSIGEAADRDMPDLSDISITESRDLQEAKESDIPEIDFSQLDAGPQEEPERPRRPVQEEFDLNEDDLASLGEIEGFGKKEAPAEEKPVKAAPPAEDIGSDFASIPDISHFDDENIKIEPFEEEEAPRERPVKRQDAPPPRQDKPKESLDLSISELNRLKRSILLFDPGLRQAVKDCVINDELSTGDMRALVDMIIDGKPEGNIHRYLEKKLGKTIALKEGVQRRARRVITSRPEYSREGIERQKRLLKLTGIFAGVAAVVFIFTIVGYQFIYKPYMAKKKIQEGAALIVKRGDYVEKTRNYARAEEIFKYVDQNYVKNYLYGYNSYGRAYFDAREYAYSLDKLNKAYELDRFNPDTLNNLGYFFSRVPDEEYRRIKPEIDRTYYMGKGTAADKTQLEVSIDFYRRVLIRDKGNVTAMYGIGRAYYHQGQYLKAKKYYEDILAVDKNSVVGYSGLLDLYIERDSFPQVVGIHAELRDKDRLEELPSDLLAKLASYYLDKKRTDRSNVRIEYGVRSSKIMDGDDNTFPAVRSALDALNKKDPDYPPLHLQLARLARAQKNYRVMKRYLDKALSLSPNYFGALAVMGEYYYYIKEPVKAYECLTRAVKTHDNQPDFTRDEFYRETESLGKSYGMLGNIFYYFFDKVRIKNDVLEDDIVDQDIEKMTNYNIAREKYESAVASGYESPEIYYNLGRIYYMDKLYSKAVDSWLHLYEDFVSSPELMLSLGNAFYHAGMDSGNFEPARGEYLKLVSVFERMAEKINIVDQNRIDHVKVFQTLSSGYNNLAAVYQQQGAETKSNICYWRAIEYASKINQENEYARVNMARAFKPGAKKGEPILDEKIPYSIDVYREEQR